MKAQLGQIYALIVDSKLHKKFTIAELPEWADQTEQPGSLYALQVVNITSIAPMPNEGDIYDGVNFTAPPPLPPIPVVIDPINELRIAMNADPTLLDKLKAVK